MATIVYKTVADGTKTVVYIGLPALPKKKQTNKQLKEHLDWMDWKHRNDQYK